MSPPISRGLIGKRGKGKLFHFHFSTGFFQCFLQRFGLKREGDIYRCSGNKEDAIVIFAHGGSGAVFISHLLNLPFPYVLTAMPYGVCSVSIFDMAPLGTNLVIPKVEIFNDMGHLGEVRKEKLRFEK